MVKIKGWKRLKKTELSNNLKNKLLVWQKEEKTLNKYLYITKQNNIYYLNLITWEVTAYGGSRNNKKNLLMSNNLKSIKTMATQYMKTH